MPGDLVEWLEAFQTGGLLLALLLAVYGIKAKWWIPYWLLQGVEKDLLKQLKDLREDRDFWREQAMKGLDVAESLREKR